MWQKIKMLITDESEIDNKSTQLISMLFLLMSGLMSFFEYTQTRIFWDYHLTFAPGFISTIIAVCLISPLYLRGILHWSRSVYSILSFILILLVFASFIQLALGGAKAPGVIVISTLLLAVTLSWLGIRGVAGVCWILVLIVAIYSAVLNNLAMGFYGFVYIVTGFLGIVLHSGLNPGQLLSDIKLEYSEKVANVSSNIKSDVNEVSGTLGL